MNKRGQNSTLTLIIVIVLGIAVLALLIFGFTTGWNNLWDKFSNLPGGGKSNLDSIQDGCRLACETKSQSAFCNDERTVKFGKEVTANYISGGDGKTATTPYIIETGQMKKAVGTCQQFANPKFVNVWSKASDATANVAAAQGDVTLVFPGLNVAPCPSLC